MYDFGRSLHVDDPSYIPARHFQNNLIPRDQPCYTCHTDYTLFGTIHAKFRGLRHIYVEYFGKVPHPADIRLYTPFNRTGRIRRFSYPRRSRLFKSDAPDMCRSMTSNFRLARNIQVASSRARCEV